MKNSQHQNTLSYRQKYINKSMMKDSPYKLGIISGSASSVSLGSAVCSNAPLAVRSPLSPRSRGSTLLARDSISCLTGVGHWGARSTYIASLFKEKRKRISSVTNQGPKRSHWVIIHVRNLHNSCETHDYWLWTIIIILRVVNEVYILTFVMWIILLFY